MSRKLRYLARQISGKLPYQRSRWITTFSQLFHPTATNFDLHGNQERGWGGNSRSYKRNIGFRREQLPLSMKSYSKQREPCKGMEVILETTSGKDDARERTRIAFSF